MNHEAIVKYLESIYDQVSLEYKTISIDDFVLWGQEGMTTPSFSKLTGDLPVMVGEGIKASWKLFPIYHRGKNIDPGKTACPATSKLLSFIPNLHNAGFSCLQPKYKIAPHVGYDSTFLRYHLGIDVPQGDTGININQDTHSWENGKSFWFDDTDRHQAWNYTNSNRIILIVDVLK